MPVNDAYVRYVRRVWQRVEQKTGHQPWSLRPGEIVCYCPSCTLAYPPKTDDDGRELVAIGALGGTLTLAFVQHPRPGFVGTCSNGCTTQHIGQALFPDRLS